MTGAFLLMPGESASSFVLRLANFLTVKPDKFLRSALGDPRNLAWAIHRSDKLQFLCDASGLPSEHLAFAFAQRSPGPPNERFVLQFRISEHHLDQTTRRVSPTVLARDLEASIPPYHRILWSVRDLRRDPETGSPLISACDHCGATLTWQNCVDPACCGRCGRQLWRARSPEDPMTRFDQFVRDLFHPDATVRSELRSSFVPPLGGWAEGDLIDLLYSLQRVQHLLSSSPKSAVTIEPAVIEAGSSIKQAMDLPIRSAALATQSTAVTVAAAARMAALRSAPPPVAEFLIQLLMSRS
ncbi:hypothetical protein WN73_37670 [Bradyrhizobium sp. CCBAU 45394]|uniref:TniQ family protein n=1 Tax=Bradyrhizobium sp. CCBAU 45394 TaxID=1325087 RepID=UPI002304C7B4|nr:TniQ family protein [Bradyrhizobium sp. CCBAU 45394]MDA9396250.1 hypothetical protein [Bradyrhizobium sp. CCBAU 45394]